MLPWTQILILPIIPMMLSKQSFAETLEAWHMPRRTLNEYVSLAKRDQLLYLCALGHLAPSSHNSQPWRFFVDEASSTITLYLDRRAILPQSDPTARQAVISAGCALENIMIGAAHYASPADCEYLPVQRPLAPCDQMSSDEEALVPLARVVVREHGAVSSGHPLFESLFTRRTNRAEFDPEILLPEDIQKELVACADAVGTSFHAVTEHARRSMIAELQAQADAYVMNSPAFTKELGEWLLPNNSSSGLGMPGATFGLSDDQALRLHRGFKGETALEPEDGLRFALAGRIGMEKSPFIGFITAEHDAPDMWIAAGRTFERLALTLTRHGFSIAVHAGIVEVPLISKMFGLSVGIPHKVLMLFRAGKPKRHEDREPPHSPRLPLEKVIITDLKAQS